MITQKVGMWGNSLGVRLPQAVTSQIGLQEGVVLSITIEGNRIVLTPARPKYTLDELLRQATSEMQHDEVDWSEPVGAENW